MQVSQRRQPVQRRSAAKVEFVLEAAAHVLEESGLAGYNTNAIADRAGISIGSLYQYFSSKEGITTALIVRAHQNIIDGLQDVMLQTQGCNLDISVSVMLDNIISTHAKSPKLLRILELEEERLPRTDELVAKEMKIEALNRAFFSRFVAPKHCDDATLNMVALDTICIVRSLLDAATQLDSLDAPDLPDRLSRTVKGYLAPLLVSEPVAARR